MSSKKNALVYRVPKQGYEEVDPEEWSDMAICDVYDSAVNANPSTRIRNSNNGKAKPTRKVNQAMRKGQGDNTLSPTKNPHYGNKKTSQNPETTSKPSTHCFKSGDTCIARYSEDNLFYKCTVLSVDNVKKTCLVEYDGYENEENVNYSDVYTLEQWNSSGAKNKQPDSVTVSGGSSVSSSYASTVSTGSSTEGTSSDVTQDIYSDSRGRRKRGSGRRDGRHVNPPFDFHAPNFVPNPFLGVPPPPFSMQSTPDLSDDALSSMLMSWYMAGYHTGFYQGSRVRRGRKKK